MSKYIPHFPEPTRNVRYPNIEDVIFQPGHSDGSGFGIEFSKRRYSPEALVYGFQYFHLEDKISQAFKYVHPVQANAKTFSIEFAAIIREACGVFEIACREIYSKMYDCPLNPKLNVLNFLSLDRYMNLSSQELIFLGSSDQFDSYPEVRFPFNALSSWKKDKELEDSNLPNWWKAYNKLKHSNEGLSDHGTLSNALAGLSALFTTLNSMYGVGFVFGIKELPYGSDGFIPNARSSLLFCPKEVLHSQD